MAHEEKLEARIAEIEAKLTLAEDLLETLNRTVYRQQQHIERLERAGRGDELCIGPRRAARRDPASLLETLGTGEPTVPPYPLPTCTDLFLQASGPRDGRRAWHTRRNLRGVRPGPHSGG